MGIIARMTVAFAGLSIRSTVLLQENGKKLLQRFYFILRCVALLATIFTSSAVTVRLFAVQNNLSSFDDSIHPL